MFFKKIFRYYIWKRMFYERLTEPLHLNVISVLVWLFGSCRAKIEFDLILRQQHAFSLLNVADQARRLGFEKVSIFEFGVAAGAGLMNLQTIAGKITKITGVGFEIYGFDTGEGMPPPKSHKDHPDLYQAGDFPMDFARLSNRLEENTHIIVGPIAETVQEFLKKDFSSAPIGFISVDVDYYSSTVDALQILTHGAKNYLPRVLIYLDDLEDPNHNSWCGELAAVNEFTIQNQMRPIEKHAFLRGYRIFKNARWIDHIYQCHILDHPSRSALTQIKDKVILTNPYL